MSSRHQTQRIRHEVRRRATRVVEAEYVTPRMKRIVFHSPELEGFCSPSPDDHVKVFVPTESGEPVMRDFTPRRFDARTRSLTLDFALHEAGAATTWAARARIGDTLEIGGPRGSRLTPDDFDWYLLIGDEMALPAIGRRVEELRPEVPVFTVVSVFDAAEEQRLLTRADWRPTWVHRGPASPADARHIGDSVSNLSLPPGDGLVWIAHEATVARSVRDAFLDRGHPREWIRAAGYWRRGAPGAHEVIGEE